MPKKLYISILFIVFISTLFAQGDLKPYQLGDSLPEGGFILRAIIVDNETVPHVMLGEVIIVPPYHFRNKRERQRYSRLVRYVRKVYPYSIMIKNTYYEINEELAYYENSKDRRKFINLKEDQLKNEFEGQLRKLTFTQGRILMKLVDRETGNTTYEVVREFKGTFNAVLWQSVALVFGSNLKKGYDSKGDDRMIEHIIVKIENGEL